MSQSSQSLNDVILQLKLWVNTHEPNLVQDGSFRDQRNAGVDYLMLNYDGTVTPEGRLFTSLTRKIEELTSKHMVRPVLNDVFVFIHRDRKAKAAHPAGKWSSGHAGRGGETSQVGALVFMEPSLDLLEKEAVA